MRVDHRRRHVRMAQEFLHCPDVVPQLQQVGGETVPEAVASRPLRQFGTANRRSHLLREGSLVGMMTTHDAGMGVRRYSC